jgi:hypothetical protein
LVGIIFCGIYFLNRLLNFEAMGMLLIGNSYMIGNALGDKKHGDSQHDHTIALAFAVISSILPDIDLRPKIIGLWIMNLFVNVIQGPARAIVADIVPPSKQQLGNAMVSNVMGTFLHPIRILFILSTRIYSFFSILFYETFSYRFDSILTVRSGCHYCKCGRCSIFWKT